MKFKEAAQSVLERAGEPMHYKEITNRAIEVGLIQTEGLTPDQTMAALLYADILTRQKRGVEPLFMHAGPGVFGLAKWQSDGAPSVVLDERLETEVAEEIIDLSGLTSTQKGRIAENRIRETILLHGGGALSVYEPSSDIEAIDLIVLKKGEFKPIYLQVKSRFGLSGKNKRTFIQDIREKTFQPHPMFFVVYAYFDPRRTELHDNLFLIPSKRLLEVARVIKLSGKDRRYRVAASIDPKPGSKWAEFVVHKTELAGVFLQKIDEAYQLFR